MFTHISGLRKYTSSTNKQWQWTNASKLHSNQSWKKAIFLCIRDTSSNFQHTNDLLPFIKNMLITMPQWLKFPPHVRCYALPSCGLLLLWTCFHTWDILTWNERFQPQFNSFVGKWNLLFPFVDSFCMDSSVIGVVEYFVTLNEILLNNFSKLHESESITWEQGFCLPCLWTVLKWSATHLSIQASIQFSIQASK